MRLSARLPEIPRRRRPLAGEGERLAGAMIPAPVAEAERSITDVLADELGGQWPYADEIPADQVTGYRLAAASEYFVPRPEFHARPHAAPETAPMAVLPDNAMVPPPPPAQAPPRYARADMAVLRRVRNGLERKWRAESFTADMRHTTGLPAFRRTARLVGWCGLDRPEADALHVRWSTSGWAERERERADAAYANAMTQALAGMEPGDIRALIGERLHAITGGAR